MRRSRATAYDHQCTQTLSHIKMLLRRRDLEIHDMLGELDIIMDPRDLSDKGFAHFYHLLKKYSFRLLLRDLIRHRNGIGVDQLVRFNERAVALRYLDELMHLDIVEQIDKDRFAMKRQYIESFGETLEWFVAQVMYREFGAPAGWSITVSTPGVGGDYDVLADIEGHLVYVETKSSPPKHIDIHTIVELMHRIDALRPHMAVLLVDTALRMRDKIVPMCEEVLRSRGNEDPIELLSGQLYHWQHRFYIINTQPSLVGNMQKALADFLRADGMHV